MSKEKYYVLEWDKKPTDSDEYDCKVTECQTATEALEIAKNSTSSQRAVGCENPLNKESDK